MQLFFFPSQCEKITAELEKQNKAKERLFKLLEDESFNEGDFTSQLNIINAKISQLEQDYKDRQSEMLESKEMKRKIKHVESFKQENQVKISYDLWQLSNDDRKYLQRICGGNFGFIKKRKRDFLST